MTEEPVQLRTQAVFNQDEPENINHSASSGIIDHGPPRGASPTLEAQQ